MNIVSGGSHAGGAAGLYHGANIALGALPVDDVALYHGANKASGVPPAGDVALFDGFALVVLFLAFAEGDDEFDVAAAGEELYGDDREAGEFLLGEGGDLALGGEELDVAGGVGAEGEVVEPELAVSESDEGAFELDVVVADAADLGAGEDEAGSELFAELVVEVGFAVDGGGGGGLLFLHSLIIL